MCAHAGTALAWSRRRRCQSPPGPRERRPLPALSRPAPRASAAGSALRERRRLRREARLRLDGGYGPPPPRSALRGLGVGCRPMGARGRGWGRDPASPRTAAGTAEQRPPGRGSRGDDPSLFCWPSGTRSRAFPGVYRPHFHTSQDNHERESPFLSPSHVFTISCLLEPVLPPPGSLPCRQVPDSPWLTLCHHITSLRSSTSFGMPA